PIVLCDLQGKTRKEAARLLEVAEGTLSTRLSRGRALLAKRLSRQGFTLSGGWLAMALAQNAASAAVPSSLVKVTVKTGVLLAAGEAISGGVISQTVIVLMEGVVKTMLLAKLKIATVFVLAVGILATANFVVYRSLAAAPAHLWETDEQAQPPKKDKVPISDEDESRRKGDDNRDKEKQKNGNGSQPQENPGEAAKKSKEHGLPKGPAPYWVCASI